MIDAVELYNRAYRYKLLAFDANGVEAWTMRAIAASLERRADRLAITRCSEAQSGATPTEATVG